MQILPLTKQIDTETNSPDGFRVVASKKNKTENPNEHHGFSSPHGRTTYDQDYVRSLFERIAFRYDFLNHFLSVGFDIVWRKKAVQVLLPHSPKRILDVATGTGDLAVALSALAPEQIVGIDIAPTMLSIARRKVAKLNRATNFIFEERAAEQLPYKSESFDAVCVAFGVRNFSDLSKGLSEMHRVLRKGGALMVLEFSHPRFFPIKQLYGFYFNHILPLMGRLISGDKEAYEYLPSTVAQFPHDDAFLKILQSIGFGKTERHSLTFGIATIYVGIKE